MTPPVSPPIELVINGRVPVKIWTDRIEPEAIEQLKNTASLPFVFHHVAAMPDVHLGIGATVGSVVATKGAVCPAAVGVDIGCGMMARKTAIPSERLGTHTLKKLRQSIEREIPVGFQQKKEPFAEGLAWARDRGRPNAASDSLMNKAVHQLGSLGGGNHFIEVCVDEDDGRIAVLLRKRPHRVFDAGGFDRGVETLAGNIGDQHARPVFVEPVNVKEIAAHAGVSRGRHICGADTHVWQ